MKYRITGFTLFLSLIFGFISKIYSYSILEQVIYYFMFFISVLISYRTYLIVEKMGVYLYEHFIKKIIDELKKTKDKIESE